MFVSNPKILQSDVEVSTSLRKIAPVFQENGDENQCTYMDI
jgi:hypothetical protein